MYIKYVLGLSDGRRIGNLEVLLREAIMEAEELGAAIEIKRLMDQNINPFLGEGTSDSYLEHTRFLSRKGGIS